MNLPAGRGGGGSGRGPGGWSGGERGADTVWFLFLFSYPFSGAQSFVSAFRNALFDWQPVTDQLPPKAAWQGEVTAQEGI